MNYGKSGTERKLNSLQSNRKKYASRLSFSFVKLLSVLVLFLGVTGVGAALGMVHGIIEKAPELNLESIVPAGYATTVYDSAGNLTDTLVKTGSNREEAEYEELPEDLINAFVAIEDARFWQHNGIDLRSIARAAWGILSGDYSGGASTITQQLIKNNVLGGGSEDNWGDRIERKIQEQYLALQLDKSMSKELIITNYLNTINLGNNTLGVKVAAKRYFNKDVSDLTLSECTVLAGITQNPSKYNPISGRAANEEKRRIILQNMVDQGYISQAEQEEALADNVYDRIQDVDLLTRENSTPYSYCTDEIIAQVMDAPTLSVPAAPKTPKDGRVEFRDVSFTYEGAQTPALSHVSFTVEPGQTVALVGPSGGGKTTAASLIPRFWDVSSGAVLVGGVDVRDMDPHVLMDRIAFVFQNSRLFKASILENVRAARPDASREQVREALMAAQCGDILEKLPEGMDTVIGTEGTYLSGGEQQRIALARAILKDAPIVVLDEATAFADPENEALIQKAFSRLMRGRTVLMIAHRLSTVVGADKILVLEQGKIAEQGTHSELAEAGGLYAKMWADYNQAVRWKIAGEREGK